MQCYASDWIRTGFVSGHGFQPCRNNTERNRALAPGMANPKRNASRDRILSPSRTFFVTTNTSMGKALLQSDRNATLLIDVLRFYGKQGKFQLHDFVVMPNHLHLLITVSGDSTVERVMQFIKGGFSYRLKRIGVFGRGVATRLFRGARRQSRELCVPSGIYCSESRQARIGGLAGKVSLLLHLSGRTKASRG